MNTTPARFALVVGDWFDGETRRGGDMVSLGVSSIGDVAGCYVQNAHKEAEYLASVDEKRHAAFRGHELSADDKLRRDVILGLMCNGVLWKKDIEAVQSRRKPPVKRPTARRTSRPRRASPDAGRTPRCPSSRP